MLVYGPLKKVRFCKGPIKSLIGNPVKIRDGPAAVIGDEHRNMPLSEKAKPEVFEKCSILFYTKKAENFNHRHTNRYFAD